MYMKEGMDMETLIWVLVAITGLFLVLVVPIIGFVALIKPSWFSKIGENRKQISLKLFGTFMVGCVLCYLLPVNDKYEVSGIKQEDSAKATSQKSVEKKETKEKPVTKEDIERTQALVDRLDKEYGGIDPKITLDEFNRIQTGMTPEEVKEIVGGLGKVASESEMAGYKTVILQFEGSGSLGANANVTFQNGKVVMKAQAGLK